MEWIKRGVSLFDTHVKTIQELCDELEDGMIDQGVLNEEQAKQVVSTMQLHHIHATERREESKARSGRDEALHRCGCDVLVGAVSFLKHPIASFIRLDEPRDLGEMNTEGHYPAKFIFLCLGPEGQQSDDYHEVGRAFACLMSNKGFLDIASAAPSKLIVCEAIHTFLAQSDIIPQFHHVRFGVEDDEGQDDSDSDSGEDEIVLSKRGTDQQLMKLTAADHSVFSCRNNTDARRPSDAHDRRPSEDVKTGSPSLLLGPDAGRATESAPLAHTDVGVAKTDDDSNPVHLQV